VWLEHLPERVEASCICLFAAPVDLPFVLHPMPRIYAGVSDLCAQRTSSCSRLSMWRPQIGGLALRAAVVRTDAHNFLVGLAWGRPLVRTQFGKEGPLAIGRWLEDAAPERSIYSLGFRPSFGRELR
jgi:hypothetical protein